MNEFKKVQVTMSLQINVFFKHSLAPNSPQCGGLSFMGGGTVKGPCSGATHCCGHPARNWRTKENK